ncbi:tRNA nucleotidyltransferase [Bathymodiolus heckerae thiotrophic gill symbiont]|uniref:polynucleotide adenylyltransferase n=1 Tax=Bathymodiolus heckerae thiotrophic gill symbiont TaxID=1052212 RepID=UPI0010B6A6C7|nr:polynucleotide adenylyltransferase [Bathymodiolus heckerae thiotrophic gill symbiont]CAC9436890.1 CCA tRNA nucleotidyltransferase (EC 2.7.7.72) [uncultured Gammaproteobacteria bacterium]SMN13329.1 tRNA nucleotidyltransferase [Bathymodiolus heckerae thiotrophic gill symbiont]SMN15583.1 tRNA nucleotidyltransferase [uncultured Candidatus Thioglobus sp.]
MKKYLVGGAVRDQLLGIADEHTEKDWLIVGSSPEEMLDLGYRQVGKDFPVFLHPGTQEEYALARVERKIGKGYKGFEFDISKSVTLEQDLSRRDLTINAIAQKDGELFDPFNGQEDLNNGILRHVSAAFSEDPVRVLRVARFAARFKPLGFKVAHTTHQLMKDMVASGEVNTLTPERVFRELEKSLSYDTPSAFFKVLSACGAYERVFSSLKTQEHHSHQNLFLILDKLGATDPHIKFSVWLKDEKPSAISALCDNIKCPKKYQQLATLVNMTYQFATKFDTQSSDEVFDFFVKTDALRRQERFAELLRTFELLGINTKRITELRDLLNTIDVAKLDKQNIAKAIQAEKQSIIRAFVQS